MRQAMIEQGFFDQSYWMQKIDELIAQVRIMNKNTFDVSEAATFLGISESRIYHLVAEKEIPHHKKNGRLTFDRLELDYWKRGERVETNEEIKQKAQRIVRRKGAIC